MQEPKILGDPARLGRSDLVDAVDEETIPTTRVRDCPHIVVPLAGL
jgi:hypothetical protein